MKTTFLSIILSLSLLCNAQADTTAQDSTHCLPARHVLHATAAAFILFYTSHAHGFAKNIKGLIHFTNSDSL